jgi:hypothetical protein
MTRRPLVILETPFAGKGETEAEMAFDAARKLRYLRACMRDSLMRGESPYASHGLYTQPGVLRDDVPEERDHGIQAGFAWRHAADLTAVYVDLGYSSGMHAGIANSSSIGVQIQERWLGPDWEVDAILRENRIPRA